MLRTIDAAPMLLLRQMMSKASLIVAISVCVLSGTSARGVASQSAAWTTAGASFPYGLGWFSQRVGGTRVIWHYGEWPQYSALYIKVPDERLTLIMLANSGGLGEAYPLAAGDVMVSPFARTFLGLFM